MAMTTPVDPEWAARHVRLMRTQPGHWCFVPGCTGSQPLMWVPTVADLWAETQPRGRAIDLLPQRSLARRLAEGGSIG